MLQEIGKIVEKKEKQFLGLMSGMSMDGVDLAHIKIQGDPPDLKVELLGGLTLPYPDALRQKLVSVTEGNPHFIPELDFEVAEYFTKAVLQYLKTANVSTDNLDAIGSHGQTIFYQTESQSQKTYNMQIGDPSYIAFHTSLPVVANFRQKDIAAGGTGAPLVPLIDFYLHRIPNQTIAMINLGSIANTTVVGDALDNVIAFDCGPANMATDFFYRSFFPNSKGYDKDGNLGLSGKVIDPLLRKLMRLPYFSRPFPKAAGYEDIGPPVLNTLLNRFQRESVADLIHTGNVWAAQALALAFEDAITPKFPELKSITLTGGGVYNQDLVQQIRLHLKRHQIHTMQGELNDSKEAIAFAVLAHEFFYGRPGNIRGATGAHSRVTLGELVLPY